MPRPAPCTRRATLRQRQVLTIGSLLLGLVSWSILHRHTWPQLLSVKPSATAQSAGQTSATTIVPAKSGRAAADVADIPAQNLKPADNATRARVDEAYGRLPLQFEANAGQTAREVKFLARGSGYQLFLTPTEAVLSLSKPTPAQQTSKPDALQPTAPLPAGPQGVGSRTADQRHIAKQPAAVVRMQLVGGNANAQISGADELPGKVNYFIGNEPAKWRTNVSTYTQVQYAGVYPGVDLVYYGNQRQLEYDFVVAPHADPRAIRLKFTGVEQVRVDEQGELVLKTKDGGEVRQHKPVIYQEVAGARRVVIGNYALRSRQEVGFDIASYDATAPLVIDPVLSYSTYLGGFDNDYGYSIAVDSAGNAYVTGSTYTDPSQSSGSFPIANARQPTSGGFSDAFVTKFNPAGNALIYSTYLGGSSGDYGYGIAVDSAGNAYITGSTFSNNFPLANAIQPVKAGFVSDAFVTKFNASGNGLVYSTFLGGSNYDEGNSIAVDSFNNAYVTGYTTSTTNFPIANARQPTYGGGFSDAFVTEFNPAGSTLIYSTYLGGNSNEFGYGIAADSAGNAYVTGYTNSNNFPLANARQPTFGGVADAFVTEFNAAGSALLYSTYLGGSGDDRGASIAVDSAGNAYVTGLTVSTTDFPTANALQPAFAGSVDAFVTEFNPTGSTLLYSTYLGGSGDDRGIGIAVNSTGNAYVTGSTASSNFPTVNALQSISAGNGSDAFVTKLNAGGTALLFSTYFGGSGNDVARGIASNANGTYLVGETVADNFPISPGALQTARGPRSSDAFVTKLSESSNVVYYAIRGLLTSGNGQPLSRVPVTLSGSLARTSTTSSDGTYFFPLLAAGGNYTITPDSSYGTTPQQRSYPGLLGNITNADFVVNQLPSGWARISGRVSNVNGRNLCATMRISGDLTASQSVCGSYFFDAQLFGNYTVTGDKSPANFSPITFTFLDGNKSNVNFVVTSPIVSIAGQLNNISSANGVSVTASGSGLSDKPCDVTTAQGGGFIYTCANLSIYGDYTITPRSTTQTFAPLNRSFDEVPGNIGISPGTLFSILQTPTLTWPTPAAIIYGTPLSGTQLNATANVPGTFVYTPPVGTILNAGAQTLSVTFTPSDTANYNTATATVRLTVQKATPIISWGNPADIPQGTPLSNTQLNATANVPGQMAYNPVAGTVLLAGNGQVLRVTFTPTDGGNYNVATAQVSINVLPPRTLTVASANPASGVSIIVSPVDKNSLSNGATQFTRSYNNNTPVTLTAPATAGSNSFQKWQRNGVDVATTLTTTITMDANYTMTAVYVTPVQVSVQTNPTGRSFTVDGTAYTATQTFSWVPGSTHNISTTSPQSGGPGTQYVWSSWSDGGAISHTVSPTSALTYTATFTTTQIPPTVQFSQAAYTVGEGDSRATFTVTRTGDTSNAATADYRTVDTDTFTVGCFDTTNNQGSAYARCDFATVVGTLSFALGETAKTITVPLSDDGYAEGPETFQVVLSNPTGASLGAPATATVTITDNDVAGQSNPVFSSPFFIRQHYLDFLSREPDTNGYNNFLNLLNGCPNVNNTDPNSTSAGCDRLNVTGQFFGSLEFQLKGSYAFRFYKLAFNRLPEYTEIVADMSFVAGSTADEVYARKAQLAQRFTQRPEFQTRYGSLSNAGYVAALVSRYPAAANSITTPDPANPDGPVKVTLTRDDLLARLNNNTFNRVQVFRAISDSDQVAQAEFNNTFVAVEYYGYLRRKPEPAGYQMWLGVLQSGDIRTMVNGFVNSPEYKLRFGNPDR